MLDACPPPAGSASAIDGAYDLLIAVGCRASFEYVVAE